MQAMAEDTGGHAFINTNGLTQAVEEAIENGSNYYTLTYAPTNAVWDSRFRAIKVKVDQPGVKLNYRNYAERLICWTTWRTASTGVVGTMPWPRLKMWPGRPAAAARTSATRASRTFSGAKRVMGSRLPWTATEKSSSRQVRSSEIGRAHV